MSESQGKDAEEQGGVPRWVKTLGAIVGILATAAGIFVGIYSLVREFQATSREIAHEKKLQAAEEAKAQKQVVEQIRLQNEAEQQRAAEGLEQLRLANEASREERDGRLAEEEQKTRQAELQWQILERQDLQAEKVAAREQRISEQKILLEAIAKLSGRDEYSYLNVLLTISRYLEDEENQDMIVHALVAYAEGTCDQSEINLIFSMLRSVPDDAFPEVVKLNRLAYRQLRAQIMDYFERLVWRDIVAPMAEESYERYACDAISSTARIKSAINPSFQSVLLHEHWHSASRDIVKVGLSTDVSGDMDAEPIRCSSELLNGSNEFIQNHLAAYAAKFRTIDLSDVHLDVEIPLDLQTRSRITSTRGAFIAFRGEVLAGDPGLKRLALELHCHATREE